MYKYILHDVKAYVKKWMYILSDEKELKNGPAMRDICSGMIDLILEWVIVHSWVPQT